MIKIYVDEQYINDDYYRALSNSFKIFNKSFKLGGVASNTFELEVDNSVMPTSFNNVRIEYNNENYANVLVDKKEVKDDEVCKMSLADAMISLNFRYDASQIVPCTTKDILIDICNKAGIELGTTEFINDDVEVDYYDNTIQARTYVGYIAEIAGGFARIGKDGKLYILEYNRPSVASLNIDDCEEFKLGEHHKITRVVYDNGVDKHEFGDETGQTLYLNSENVFINNKNQVENIFNSINEFEFYSFSTGNSVINTNIMAGDVITFTDGVNEYKTIAQYDLKFNGDWYGGYSLELNSERQEETKIIGINTKVKSLTTKVNRSNAELQIIAQKSDEIVDSLENEYYDKYDTEQLIINAEKGLTNIYTQTGGLNLLQNTAFKNRTDGKLDYWVGDCEKVTYYDAVSLTAGKLKNGELKQNIILKNGIYSMSLKYVKLLSTANGTIEYNGKKFILEDKGEIKTTGEITTTSFELKINCDTDGGILVYDIMLNAGDVNSVWTQSANEINTSTVSIGKGILVENSNVDTYSTMDADGVRVVNINTNTVVMKTTEDGGMFNNVEANKGTIGGLSITKIDGHSKIVGV